MKGICDYEEDYKNYKICGVKNGMRKLGKRTASKGITVFIYRKNEVNGKEGVIFYVDGLLSDQTINEVDRDIFYDTLWKVSLDIVKPYIDRNSVETLESKKEYQIKDHELKKYLSENEE